MDTAIKMVDITKRFPGVVANDHVNLEVCKGEILALVGENGAGKSTLMNILYGLHTPNGGEIYIDGQKASYSSPLGAIQHGIGMVHQHFTLVPRLSIAENIVLGREPKRGFFFDRDRAKEGIAPLLEQFHIGTSPDTPVREVSLGTQQKIEIIKALYRGAKVLILDEPTAVLTPQEIEELGHILQNLKQQGMTIIIITHKLQEVKDFSDRISVMRRGKNIGTVITAQTEISEIITMMVGRALENDLKKEGASSGGEPLLELKDISYTKNHTEILRNINLTVHKGEILGIAGIDGSGQDELTEIIDGMIRQYHGEIIFRGQEINHLGPMARRREGMGFIPQDRHRYGLVLDFNIEENLVLGFQRNEPFNRRGMIDFKARNKNAKTYIEKFDIRTPGEKVMASGLSGGNQQKVIIAREMSMSPTLIVANQPTRGVDIGAIEFIHNTLIQARNDGCGVLLVSLELDELLDLCDRIAVMYSGRVMGILPSREATREKIGMMMVGKRLSNDDAACAPPQEVG